MYLSHAKTILTQVKLKLSRLESKNMTRIEQNGNLSWAAAALLLGATTNEPFLAPSSHRCSPLASSIICATTGVPQLQNPI